MSKIRAVLKEEPKIQVQITQKGQPGASAYEIWLELGNEGSEQDFIDSLKGEDGGVGDYDELNNRPIIGGKTVSGEKELEDYGLTSISVDDIEKLW